MPQLTQYCDKCALLAGVVSAAFSWRDLEKMFWTTKSLWYGSLIMDLTSISLAMQQSLAMNRLCCYSDRWKRIRLMLGKPKDVHGISKPRWTQLYVWQVPIMLLNIGLVLFLSGLIAEIFSHFESPLSHVDAKVRPTSFGHPPCREHRADGNIELGSTSLGGRIFCSHIFRKLYFAISSHT